MITDAPRALVKKKAIKLLNSSYSYFHSPFSRILISVLTLVMKWLRYNSLIIVNETAR